MCMLVNTSCKCWGSRESAIKIHHPQLSHCSCTAALCFRMDKRGRLRKGLEEVSFVEALGESLKPVFYKCAKWYIFFVQLIDGEDKIPDKGEDKISGGLVILEIHGARQVLICFQRMLGLSVCGMRRAQRGSSVGGPWWLLSALCLTCIVNIALQMTSVHWNQFMQRGNRNKGPTPCWHMSAEHEGDTYMLTKYTCVGSGPMTGKAAFVTEQQQ